MADLAFRGLRWLRSGHQVAEKGVARIPFALGDLCRQPIGSFLALIVPDKLGREQALEARLIIEDVKGRDPRGDTALSKLKIKIFEALYRAQGFRVTFRQAEGY